MKLLCRSIPLVCTHFGRAPRFRSPALMLAGLGLALAGFTAPVRAGVTVVGYPSVLWSANDAALALAGYTIEDFEDATLAPNLLVGCESPAGNLVPTNTLPALFNPTNDAYGSAFRPGVWDGEHCLVNTRDNQSHSYGESQHWGNILLEFPARVRSVAFSVQNLELAARIEVNGTDLGAFSELTGLASGNIRNGLVRLDAADTNAIATIRLSTATSGGYDGIVIDHLAFSTNPPPFQFTSWSPGAWAANDWVLGVAGWCREDFEDTNLAPHLLVGWETGAGNFAPAVTLPNVFDPTNDAYGTAFQGALWDGSHGLLNTRDNQSHGYTDAAQWGDTVLQFSVLMRAAAFSVQQMELDARLVINGADYGALTRLAGLDLASGREGYVRIEATGTNAITSIKLDNAWGDGFVLDHLAYAPAGVLADGGAGIVAREYASVTDPVLLSFAPDGSLFAGRDASGSGGGSGDAVKVHRVGVGGATVGEYGEQALYDPDGVCVDPTGSLSGVAGAVLVAGGAPTGNFIAAIRPDQTLLTLYGPTHLFENPDRMEFDRTGRLLIQSYSPQPGVFVWPPGGSPVKLITLPGSADPYCFAVSPDNRIFVLDEFGVLRAYGTDGSLHANDFATGLHNARFAFAPGGEFGNDLWLVKTNGDLLRFDANGVATTVATNLPRRIYDLAFGPDGAMYLSDFFGDRIWRVTLANDPFTKWPAGQGGNDHWYSAVLVGTNGIHFNQASNAAVSLGGHLVAITSEAENSFVLNLITNPAFWFIDGANNGEGPWIGGWQPAGSSEPGGNWQWVTGEPWAYTRWAGGEPNNSGGAEDRTCFFAPGTLMGTVWNDVGHDGGLRGYVAEFSAFPSAPVFTSATNFTVTAGQPLMAQLSASGQPTAFFASGLPAGLALDPVTGAFSGVTTNLGAFPLQVAAANPFGVTTQALTLVVQPPAMPTPPGLLAWWTGDDTAADVAGAHHGQLRNGATFAAGKVGSAFRLDGVNDFVEMPNVVQSNAAFSFAFWLKADSFTHANYMGAFCQENGSTALADYEGWFYYTGNSPTFHSLGMQGSWTGDTGAFDLRVVEPLQAGVWYHVTATYDGAKLRQYLNGALRNEVSYANKVLGNPWPLLVGKLTAFPGSGHVTTYFHGLLDEIMFFNRALSSNEVAQIVAADSAGVVRPIQLSAFRAYDLAADWSTNQNPLGVWSLYKSESALFQTYQPGFGWADQPSPQTAHVPVWGRAANGTNVSAHGAELDRTGSAVTKARWTSPTNGVATISGCIWMPVDQGRRMGWQLRKNGAVLTAGEVFSGDPYNAANPFRFELAAGSAVLRQTVVTGDYLELALISLSDSGNLGESVSLNFHVELDETQATPPPGGLAAWWPGDGNARDVVGWNHGWLTGGAGFANGLVDRAFVFDSDDDRVIIPHSETLDVSSNGFTCEFWMKADKNQPQDAAAMVDKSHGFVDFTGWTFHVWRADGRLSFGIGDGTTFPPLYSTTDVLDDRWHHVAGVWDRTNWLIYVDGALENLLARPMVANNPRPLLFGYAWGGGTAQRFYRGMLDEVRLYPRALSAGEIAASASAGGVGQAKPACLPPLADLVAWLPGEGNAGDLASGLDGVMGAGVSFTEGRVGRAFQFTDTADSHIQFPNVPAFQPANNQFTIEAWVKPDFSSPNQIDTLFEKRDACSASYSFIFSVLKALPGYGTGVFGLGMQPQINFIGSTNRIPDDGQFHHVAVSYNGGRSNGNCLLYLDGRIAGGGDGPGVIPASVNGPIIGRHNCLGTHSRMALDELCFFSRELSSSEITSLYAAGSAGVCQPAAPVPPPAGQVAWWRAEGDARDTLGNHHGAPQNGITFTNGVAGAAFQFDGVNDGVIVPHDEALNISSNGFTVEFWMRGDKNQSGQEANELCLIEKSHGWVQPYAGWAVQVLSDGRLGWGFGAGGNTFPSVRSPADVLDGQFHHIAGTYDGTNIALYVDGQMHGLTNYSGLVLNNMLPVNLGFTWGNGTPRRFFRGDLDEVSVYQRALSAGEIRAIVGAGTFGKQPPGSVLPPGNMLAWWPLNGDFADVVGGLNGVAVGAPSFADGMVQTSLQLDGQTQWASLPSGGILNGRTEATIEAWVRPQGPHGSLGNPGAVWFEGTSAFGYTRFAVFVLNDGSVRVGGRDSNTGTFKGVDSLAAIPTDAWTHVAGTWKAGEGIKVFVNGVLNNTRTDAGLGAFTADAAYAVCLGGSGMGPGTNTFNGGLDEVAVYGRALSSVEIAAIHAAGSAGKQPPQCVSPGDRLVAWWRGEGDGREVTGNHPGTLLNGVAFTNGFTGQAFAFDGVDDAVTVADSRSLRLTNALTIQFWARRQRVGIDVALEKGGDWTDGQCNYGVGLHELNNRMFYFFFNGGWRGTDGPADFNWHHYAVVARHGDANPELYIDGTRRSVAHSGGVGTINLTGNSLPLHLGAQLGTHTYFGNLILDEMAMWNRALTTNELAALYAAQGEGMCPPQCAPPPAGLTHWFKADNQADDAVGGLIGALEGGATFALGRVGSAFSFDGANDLVTCTNFPNLGTNDFSVALWYRADTTTAAAGNMKLVNKGMTLTGTPQDAGIQVRLQSGTLNFRLADEAGLFSETAVAEPAIGLWHHVAAVANRSAKVLQFYVDGALAAQTNYTALGSIDTNIRFAIGALDRRPGSSALAEFFDGLIDEVTFYDRPLGSNEVATMFAAGSAGFCPTIDFDATDAFTTLNGNPNGAWSYGWMPVGFGAFTPYVNHTTSGNPQWYGWGGDHSPSIWLNLGGPAYGVPTGWLSLHPGPGTEPSIMRWTAPASGVARVAGQFLPGDSGAMQVAVRRNGQVWWNAADAGSFDLTTEVAAGATIDFTVYGGYGAGNTPIAAAITLALNEAVPPVILTQPTNQIVLATRDVTLAVAAYGSAPLSYQWFFTNAPLSGATSPSLALPLVTTNQAGTYFVVITNHVGSVTSQPVVLTVLPDSAGPTVASFTPAGVIATNFNRLALRFSERVNTNTFTADDLTVITPGGSLSSGSLTLQAVAPFDNSTFEVLLPMQSAEGLYQVQVGPNVADYAGNNMAAAFTAQFVLDQTGPVVTNVLPSGIVSNTITWFDVDFDSAIPMGGVVPGDAKLTGPGAPGVSSIGSRGTHGVRVWLNAPVPQGQFTLVIGPDVPDLAGNLMPAPHTNFLQVYLPDLALHEISTPPTALAGQPLNLSWLVTNQGPGNVTGTWKSRVQLATNAAGDGAIALGTFTATNLISSTATLSQTGLVILPATAAGERWFIVTADSDNEVFEHTETNNTFVATTPVTLLTPDLALANVSAPAAAQFGQAISVNWAVTNVGTAPAGAAWSDRVYLSATSNSIAGATLLATVAANANPLAPAAGYPRAASVTLPFSAQSAPGTFWIVAVADSAEAQPEASEANNRRSAPISLTLPPLPNLAIAALDSPGFALPGRAVELSWIVTNRGSVTVTGAWKETLWFTNASFGAQALSQFTFSDALAPGQFLTRTQSVTLPLNGPADTVWFGVELDSRNDVIEESESDNLSWATNATGVPLLLTLQLAATQIAENATPPTLRATLTRNGDRGLPLAVTITNSDPTELSAPTTVVIAAGEFAAEFNLIVQPDGIVDGPRVVTVAASATNFTSASVQVTVLDADFPRLTLTLTTNTVREGNSLAAAVSSDVVLSEALAITLGSSSPAQLSLPPTVVIPAGSNSVSFTVSAQDDSLVEPTAGYGFSAQAAGFLPADATVQVLDDDVPQVTLTLASPSVSEAAGASATLATVTRSPVSARSLVVELTSSDVTEATVPARVTIPPNQSSAAFAVGAVQDALVDGTQTSVLGGYVLATENNARVTNIQSATLTITDDDGPALQLTVANKLVREGQAIATAATVTRNTGTTGNLVVSLASSDLSEATVPPTVTILDGQTSATFNVTSLADGTNDGNQTVMLTANASGFGAGADTVIVSDSDLPDLFVASISAPATLETETYATVSYRVANQGFVPTTGSFLTRVFLSTAAAAGNDTLAGQFRFNGSLPPGQSFEQTLQVRLPQAVGDYWVIVETDVDHELAEPLENNNVAISAAPIHAAAAYRASVATEVTDALAGTPIPLTGRATNNLGAGVAFKPVTIHIVHNGTTRLVAAITDAGGNYSVVWTPLPGEAGLYELGADHPGASTTTTQDTFILRGLRANVGSVSHSLPGLGAVNGEFELQNLSSLPLTALAGTIVTTPNVSVSLQVTNSLPGAGAAKVSYTITSLMDADAVVTFTFRFTTAEGAHAEVPATVVIQARRPHLRVTPGSLDVGMVRGEQRFVELEVVNVGGLASSPITLSLPAVPWLQIASTNPIPALAPGETNRFTLQVLPPPDLPIGEYDGNLGMGGDGLFVSVPFHFKIVSSAFGDVRITTVDESTYYGTTKSNLAGATVVLRDPFNNAEVARGTTAADGVIRFENLREGNYNLEVTAPKHDTSQGVVEVRPGQLADRVVFLRTQLVTYRWTVEEIEIEDRTKITLETTFETFVPTPVVTITPNLIDLQTIVGNEAQVDLKIENHGLIAANDVKLVFGTHDDWELTPLISDLGVLPARSTLTVPVMIRRLSGGGRPTAAKSPGSKDCSIPAHLEWTLVCGPFGVMYPVPIIVAGASADCGGGGASGAYTPPMWGDPTTSGGGGGGGGGGSGPLVFVSKPPTYSPTNNCACDASTFHEECVSGTAGISVDVMDSIKAAINTALAPYFMSVDSVSASLSLGGEVCTCCEDGVKGLKASVEAGSGIEVVVVVGFNPGFTTTFDHATFGKVTADASFTAGLVITLSGSAKVTVETECFLRNPKTCFSGSIGLNFAPQITGTVELSTENTAGDKYGGEGEATVKLETGISINIQGCNDGTPTRVFGKVDDLVFTAGIGGQIKMGDHFVGIGYEYKVTLAKGGCIPSPCPGDRPELTPTDPLAQLLGSEWSLPLEVESPPSLKPLTPDATALLARSEPTTATPTACVTRPRSTATASSRRVEYVAAPPQPAVPEPAPAAPAGPKVAGRNDAGVCAQVRLQIEQEAVFTRKAVGATLEIFNQSDTVPLENLNVAISIYDGDGNLANDRFHILAPELTAIVPAGGGTTETNGIVIHRDLWHLDAATTGKARWVILPLDNAAPDGPTTYYVGGIMNYTAGDVPSSARLFPSPVQVYPNARLRLRYFHQRDVFSDDPFTEVVEPAIPFSLGVLVQNVGRGLAKDFKITSAEPRIIENEKGLLIDFDIIATEVAGQAMAPSLTVNFGNLGPGDIGIGRWLLTATLQGLFVNYSARFEHEDSLGGRATSLIEQVTIHETLHFVQAPGAFEDGKPDFLVNDTPDPNDLPDALYLSDGTTNPVAVVTQSVTDAPPGAGHLAVQLLAPMPTGWAYLRVPEPGDGAYILKRVVRSDSVEVYFNTNVWTTDRTFIGVGRRPLNEHNLHLLDYNSPGSYTLYFELPPAPDTNAPGSAVAALPASAPEVFQVQWSGADDASGIASYDVYFSVNGGSFLPWLQKTKLSAAVFQGALGSQYAFYSVAVDASGNREVAPLTPDASTSVTITNHAPVITAPGDQVMDENTAFSLQPVVTDADLPDDQLTFSLLTGPPGLTLNPLTGAMSWTTGEGHGSSTNLVAWRVADNRVPQKSATNSFTLIVNEVNTAPVMAAINNTNVLEGRWLALSNWASDADLPAQTLTWSLLNPPAGATIDAASGLFRWRPNEFQGGATNVLTIVVRDDGPGQLAVTQTMVVAVGDALSDFVVHVGTTNLLAGGGSYVPLSVVAGVPLTNVTFTLALEESVLTNLVLQPRAAGLSATSLQRVETNLFRATLELSPGNSVQGTQELARLQFSTSPQSASAIVPLAVGQVAGHGADGVFYDKGAGGSGRVFVIGAQPILSDLTRSNQTTVLTVYGRPGARYRIEGAPTLGPTGWSMVALVQPAGTVLRVSLPPTSASGVFYRAVAETDAGLLTIRSVAGQHVIEWVPTRPNCALESTAALGINTVWNTVQGASVVLTNGVARVTLAPDDGTKFYRLRCD